MICWFMLQLTVELYPFIPKDGILRNRGSETRLVVTRQVVTGSFIPKGLAQLGVTAAKATPVKVLLLLQLQALLQG